MASIKIAQVAVIYVVLITWSHVETSLLQRFVTSLTSYHNSELKGTPYRKHRRATAEECSANYTVTSKGGNLTSPGYPKQYPSNLHCKWRLTSSKSNIILKFSHVDVEETMDCEYDYILVYGEKGNMTEKLCGTHSNKLLFLNSTVVDIVFHTDNTYSAEGFSLEYFLEVASGCQTVLKGQEGTVTSPLYPDHYPQDTDCHTTIIVDPGSRIQLVFDVLSLEFHQECSFDYVQVYDGATKDSPSLGRFCSDPEKASVTSTNNTMLIHFHSDSSMNNEGFSATFTSIFPEIDETGGCIWKRGKKNGTITSPNYPEKYPSNSHCVVRIEGPEDHVVSIFIVTIKLEADANCSYDRLEFRDGIDEESPLLGYFCGNANEEKYIASTGNSLYVAFDSDELLESDGFYIEYRIMGKDEDVAVNGSSHSRPFDPARDSVHSPEFFIQHPYNATVVEKESHVMPCKPKSPKAKIKWSKDGEVFESLPNLDLLYDGKILWIHSMSEGLKGTYTCTAEDPEGSSHSVHAHLGMSERMENCSIIFRHIPKNTTISEGDSNFLRCSLSSSNGGNITWMKDGIPIEDNLHFQQLPNGYLMINKATLRQTGVYTCFALEEETGCVRKYSVLVKVLTRVNREKVCGRPTIAKPSSDLGKIIGGTKAQKGAYPWQVMLREFERGTFCGGALLNEQWFVTAAHCFYKRKHGTVIDISKVDVVLGKHNQFVMEPHEVTTGIEDYFIHPQYNIDSYDNDIAMIKLLDIIQFTDYISPVCLGDPNFVRNVLLDKELPMGTVTGWGRLTERGGRPQYLQEVRVPVVDWDICRQSTRYKVTRNMFCAGYGQEIIGDACKGDSGGPLVMEKDNVWYLVGIVSWGDGCGKEGQYGFYTKVDNYHLWIVSKLN